MSTTFKPGDIVRFKESSIRQWETQENYWHHGYPFKLTDSFTILKWNGFNWHCLHPACNNSLGFYTFAESSLELALPRLTKEELIIQKIKYLNKRYTERKHATI